MIEKKVTDEESYPLLAACKCKKKCVENISENTREHQQTVLEIQLITIVKNCVSKVIILTNPKRRRKKYRSSFSREHVLDDHQNKSHNVCKVFFLGILGYKSDKVITNTLIITRPEDIAPPPDKPDDTLYHAKFYYPVLQLT